MKDTNITATEGKFSCPETPELGNNQANQCADSNKSWSQRHSECETLITSSSPHCNFGASSDFESACDVKPQVYTTLKIGDEVCLKNHHIVGEIVSIEGCSAQVYFVAGNKPKSVLLSELILASDIVLTRQPTYVEEDEEPGEAAIQVKSADLYKQRFDYSTLSEETRSIVLSRTSEIKDLIRSTTQNILDIGQKLAEVQELLRHDKKGGFRLWIETEFIWAKNTAYRFIQVWESFGNCPNLGQLHIATSALYLLAARSTPEQARAHALVLASEGVHITHKLAKELVAQQKPKGKPHKSLLSKEAIAEDAKNLFKSGDLVELKNPPPESGWSPGDRAYLEDVSYETQAVLLKLDPNQIGRFFKSFSFDDIQKVDTSKPQRAVLPQLLSPPTPTFNLLDLSNYAQLRDEELKSAFKALKQNLKAIKLELTRRHSSNGQKSQNGSVLAVAGVEK